MGDNEEELFPTLVEAPPQPVLEFEDDFEEEVEEEPLVPEITTREKIKQDEMFVSNSKNIKVEVENNEDDDNIEPEPEPLPQPTISAVKPVKKKRQMSEAQKKKLAEARAKALQVRKENAQKRKEEKDLINQEKELTKKVRAKKVEKMKEEIDDNVVSNNNKNVSFTQEDLNKAVLEGIAGYDKIRKAQKKLKKEAQAEEERKKQIFNTINKATNNDPDLLMWGHCFK